MAQENGDTPTGTENGGEGVDLPIRIVSTVIPGFGRGSKDLGIPTANLNREKSTCAVSFETLPCGIYWGFARIGKAPEGGEEEDGENSTSLGTVFKTAVSIGYNPTYGNDEKTVEPHLIAPPDHPRRHLSSCGETLFQDFYGETIRLSVVGYLRPELPFEGLDKLTEAIKKDITDAERLGSALNQLTEEERKWVESDEDT